MALNLVAFTGRLGADAEVRYTSNGTPVVRFRLANTRRYKDAAGQPKEETTWMGVVAWDNVAIGIAEYLTRGREVTVEGRLVPNEWTDENGTKRSTVEIRAAFVHLGAGPRDADDDTAPTTPAKTKRAVAAKPAAAKSRKQAAVVEDDVDEIDEESEDEAPW